MRVGVVVARFQVHTLHLGHTRLLEEVSRKQDRMIVVLGVSPTLNTMENPLDFETRRLMVNEAMPNALVLPLNDHPDDNVWSLALDSLLLSATHPRDEIILYGGRDSFREHYHGNLKTLLFAHTHHKSGTDIRADLGNETSTEADFRHGVIWASQNRYPQVFPTVDVALYHKREGLLLCRKPGVERFQLVGGFADPKSESYEADAIRELWEEAGMWCDSVDYVGSFLIDDWRYRKGPDKIKTLLFNAYNDWGNCPKAQDDIEEVRWFNPDEFVCTDPGAEDDDFVSVGMLNKYIVPYHHKLIRESLIHHYYSKG